MAGRKECARTSEGGPVLRRLLDEGERRDSSSIKFPAAMLDGVRGRLRLTVTS